MRAGNLRHRVVIQEKTVSQNGYGEEVITWTEVNTVWAAIMPLRGREYLEQRQAQADISHRVRMRHQDSITPAMRLTHGSRVFEILSVTNPAERDIQLELFCKEAVDG